MLQGSRDVLQQVIEEDKPGYVKNSWLTTTHFLGRQHFQLASFGVERQINLDRAGEFFEQSLLEYQSLRQINQPNPAAECFNLFWLARTDMERGDFIAALRHLVLSQYLINEHGVQNPEGAKGIEAHFYLLSGGWQLKKGDFDTARQRFNQALQIRRESSPYSKGEADAALGLAAVDLHQKKYVALIVHAAQAATKYKFSLLKSVLGG